MKGEKNSLQPIISRKLIPKLNLKIVPQCIALLQAMILNVSVNLQWRATYIVKTELSPAYCDKERNRCWPVRHTAPSKNSKDDSRLYYANYASPRLLLKLAKFRQMALRWMQTITLRKPALPSIPRRTLTQTTHKQSSINSETAYKLSESHFMLHHCN